MCLLFCVLCVSNCLQRHALVVLEEIMLWQRHAVQSVWQISESSLIHVTFQDFSTFLLQLNTVMQCHIAVLLATICDWRNGFRSSANFLPSQFFPAKACHTTGQCSSKLWFECTITRCHYQHCCSSF